MERAKIGIVTGLAAEAKWLNRAGFMVETGGGSPAGAERAAQSLMRNGAQGLISFGLAGGLQPGLPPGTILVPSSVIDGLRTYPADYVLMSFLGGSTGGAIHAGLKIAESAHDKALIYLRGQPVAIDLESGGVARAAAAQGLPFAVLRAIADPAERDLPPAALVAIRDDGTLDIVQLALSLIKNPKQIPALKLLGQDAKAARTALLARLQTLPERTF